MRTPQRYLDNAKFYRSKEWKQTAERAQIRDHFTCTYPGCTYQKTLGVHHIKPLLSGGARLDMANLTVLCWRHHTAAHDLLRCGKPLPAFCIKPTSSKLSAAQIAAIWEAEKEERAQKAQQQAADKALLPANPLPPSQPTSKGKITTQQRLALLDLKQHQETEPPPKPSPSAKPHRQQYRIRGKTEPPPKPSPSAKPHRQQYCIRGKTEPPLKPSPSAKPHRQQYCIRGKTEPPPKPIAFR